MAENEKIKQFLNNLNNLKTAGEQKEYIKQKSFEDYCKTVPDEVWEEGDDE